MSVPEGLETVVVDDSHSLVSSIKQVARRLQKLFVKVCRRPRPSPTLPVSRPIVESDLSSTTPRTTLFQRLGGAGGIWDNIIWPVIGLVTIAAVITISVLSRVSTTYWYEWELCPLIRNFNIAHSVFTSLHLLHLVWFRLWIQRTRPGFNEAMSRVDTDINQTNGTNDQMQKWPERLGILLLSMQMIHSLLTPVIILSSTISDSPCSILWAPHIWALAFPCCFVGVLGTIRLLIILNQRGSFCRNYLRLRWIIMQLQNSEFTLPTVQTLRPLDNTIPPGSSESPTTEVSENIASETGPMELVLGKETHEEISELSLHNNHGEHPGPRLLICTHVSHMELTEPGHSRTSGNCPICHQTPQTEALSANHEPLITVSSDQAQGSQLKGPNASVNIQHLDKTGKIKRTEKIYSGSGSDVFKGTLLNENGDVSDVSIKLIRVHTKAVNIDNDKQLRKRFKRVLQVSLGLRHPNIVPLIGFTTASGIDVPPTLISPWYSNGNVVEYLESHPQASRPHLLHDSIKGLEYLHSLFILHGDIKAENILVNDDGIACLADFGISNFIQMGDDPPLHGSSSSTLQGTLRFFSPEELSHGKTQELPTDIWKFGCSAIQIMTGKLPYPTQDTTYVRITGLIMDITSGVPPLDLTQESMSPGESHLWGYISKCWSVEPGERPTAVILRHGIEETIALHYPTRSF